MSFRSLRIAIVVSLLTIFCGAALGQKIKVEFDKSVDFSSYKTFAWDPTPSAAARPMLVAAIKAAVTEEFVKRGMNQVASDPGIYVQMYGGTDSDASISYSDLYYGPGGITPFDQSFLMWGAVPGSVTTVVVHKGELIVDVIDANRKKLVWRGKANEKLSDKRQKALDQVNKAVEKMFAQYPVKK